MGTGYRVMGDFVSGFPKEPRAGRRAVYEVGEAQGLASAPRGGRWPGRCRGPGVVAWGGAGLCPRRGRHDAEVRGGLGDPRETQLGEGSDRPQRPAGAPGSPRAHRRQVGPGAVGCAGSRARRAVGTVPSYCFAPRRPVPPGTPARRAGGVAIPLLRGGQRPPTPKSPRRPTPWPARGAGLRPPSSHRPRESPERRGTSAHHCRARPGSRMRSALAQGPSLAPRSEAPALTPFSPSFLPCRTSPFRVRGGGSNSHPSLGS